MNPVEPPEYEGSQRLVWKGPTPDISDLVVRYYRASGESLSVWSLSFDERSAILDGANIVLSVIGPHPPISLAVQGVAS